MIRLFADSVRSKGPLDGNSYTFTRHGGWMTCEYHPATGSKL